MHALLGLVPEELIPGLLFFPCTGKSWSSLKVQLKHYLLHKAFPCWLFSPPRYGWVFLLWKLPYKLAFCEHRFSIIYVISTFSVPCAENIEMQTIEPSASWSQTWSVIHISLFAQYHLVFLSFFFLLLQCNKSNHVVSGSINTFSGGLPEDYSWL